MNTINKWDYAPEWANYYAMDSDGSGWWYESEPKFINGSWGQGGYMLLADNYQLAAAAHSLEARPVQAPRPAPLEPVAVTDKVDRDTPEE